MTCLDLSKTELRICRGLAIIRCDSRWPDNCSGTRSTLIPFSALSRDLTLVNITLAQTKTIRHHDNIHTLPCSWHKGPAKYLCRAFIVLHRAPPSQPSLHYQIFLGSFVVKPNIALHCLAFHPFWLDKGARSLDWGSKAPGSLLNAISLPQPTQGARSSPTHQLCSWAGGCTIDTVCILFHRFPRACH